MVRGEYLRWKKAPASPSAEKANPKNDYLTEKNKYDTLFTHWCYDPHIDHREIGNMSIWLSRKIEKMSDAPGSRKGEKTEQT